jgi:hypothetical protein
MSKAVSFGSLGTESRKVLVFVPVFVVATALLWFGRVDQANWVDLTKWSVMALFAGLTAEHFAGGKGG